MGFFKNLKYFLHESKTIYKRDKKTNFFSVISIALILIILGGVSCVWLSGSQLIDSLEREAEMGIYFEESLSEKNIANLKNRIKALENVNDVKLITKIQAMDNMKEILGKDSEILNLFENNPFGSHFEVQIEMDKREDIRLQLEKIKEITYIRDNEDALSKLQSIIQAMTIIGVVLLISVGTVTIIVIQHIIRQGIYNNREEIRTLKLLGAPDSFISVPYLFQGVTATFKSAIIAMVISSAGLYLFYRGLGKFSFIPIPEFKNMMLSCNLSIVIISFILGSLGSLLGLRSLKE